MSRPRFQALIGLACCDVTGPLATPALAQSWPAKSALQASLKQSFIVENKAGNHKPAMIKDSSELLIGTQRATGMRAD